MDEIQLLLDQCYLHALHVRNLSPLYISAVRLSCRVFFEYAKVTKLSQCTQDTIESWLLDGRAHHGWSAATYRSYHRNVWFFFRYLLKRGKIEMDPTKGLELPKLGHQLPKGLSAEDAERVIAMVRRMKYSYRFESKRNTALIATMIFTWLRKSEAVHLQMEDVNLSEMTIRVLRGKGNKDRIVPISTRLATILRDYLLDRQRLGKNCESFFVSAQYDSPMPVKAVNLLMSKLRDRTGLNFSSHSLRHTFATLMLEGGCDLYTLSRMMGHSKITTTTIYLACSTKMLASSIEKHPLN